MGNTLSILHRFTGIALALGLPALTYWLLALARGADAYRTAQRLFASPFGSICLVGWSLSFFYHLINGIRHLGWDVGLGFERPARQLSGWIAVGGAVVLTIALWGWLWFGEHS